MTYKYKGPGYVPGVPARDLTNAEAEEYGVTDSPVYEKVTRTAPPPASEPAREESSGS